MGFDLDMIDAKLTLSRDDFIGNMNICINHTKLFTDTKDSEFLFGVKIRAVKTVKAYLGLINSILKNWGLYFKVYKKKLRIKKTDKISTELSYGLEYLENINEYV